MAKDYHAEKKLMLMKKTNTIVDTLPAFTHDFFLRYCRTSREMSERTIYEYAIDIRTYFRYLEQINPIAKRNGVTIDLVNQQTPRDLDDFIAYTSMYTTDDDEIRTNKATGRSRKVATLRCFFRYLYAMGDIDTNPASILASPSIPRKDIIRMNRDESDSLIRAIQNLDCFATERQKNYAQLTQLRDIAIVITLLGTGIRVSELVGLSLKDINWREHAMRVVRKGGDEQTVYFNDDVADAILSYIKDERKMPEDEDDIDALFVSLKRTRLTERAVEKMIRKYAEQAVSQKHITAHKLRSSYGTNLYQETRDIKLVSTALGHRVLQTSEKYIDMDNEIRREAGTIPTWTHLQKKEDF